MVRSQAPNTTKQILLSCWTEVERYVFINTMYLGLDVGTQGCKALLWDESRNEVISRGSFSYGIIPSDVQGRAEQHPDTWIQVHQLQHDSSCISIAKPC